MSLPHIAIVDDDPDLNEMLRIRLSHEGYHVTSHTGGIDLLASLGSQAPELIVLDLNMPEMSGHQVAFHMHENHPETRIVIMTAAQGATEKDRSEFWSQAIAYFQKPFELDELVATVKKHVPPAASANDNAS